jgi:hypothetical protein
MGQHGWKIAALGMVLVAGSGCTSSSEGDWGKDAMWPVDGGRVFEAARDAVLDPQTWAPAAGALLIACIDDADHKVSRWATEHTPIFGSQQGASRASDVLVGILGAETAVTLLATPSGEGSQWVEAKARGSAVELGSLVVTEGAVMVLKEAGGRDRPDGGEEKSFPSSHAAAAFAASTLSNRNLDSIDMSGFTRGALQVGNVGLASGVAWARVEGRNHYPSDVLAGAALGHLITAFIHDAFMNLPKDGSVDVAVTPLEGGGAVSVGWRF